MKHLDLLVPSPVVEQDQWKWGTIDSVDGAVFYLKLDGEDQVIDSGSLVNLAGPLSEGDRVWVQLANRRVIVHARSGGSRMPVDIPWTDLTGISPSLTGTSQYRRVNGVIEHRLNVALVGDLSVPTSGDLGNLGCGTLPSGFRPSFDYQYPVRFGNGGNMYVYLPSSGTVTISSADSRNVAYTISAGTTIRGSLTFLPW